MSALCLGKDNILLEDEFVSTIALLEDEECPRVVAVEVFVDVEADLE